MLRGVEAFDIVGGLLILCTVIKKRNRKKITELIFASERPKIIYMRNFFFSIRTYEIRKCHQEKVFLYSITCRADMQFIKRSSSYSFQDFKSCYDFIVFFIKKHCV